ncbi:MAG: cytochrome C oxidase subunit IV family protein [Gemmatimonadales bacterium]|nr:cytochrome C oxidase subunit IV family protein [Gemmatimonadales bacterium]
MTPPTNSATGNDYHGHPNYIKVWAWLVVALVMSLALGGLGNHRLAVALIFTLSIVKAILVLGNFMHLRWEPRLVWLIAGFALLCVVFLYFGVLPDLLFVPLTVSR